MEVAQDKGSVVDSDLEKLAEEELLREAQKGAQRAELRGATGWMKCTLPRTNKTFLQNTLAHTIRHNRHSGGRKDKFKAMLRSLRKTPTDGDKDSGDRDHSFYLEHGDRFGGLVEKMCVETSRGPSQTDN